MALKFHFQHVRCGWWQHAGVEINIWEENEKVCERQLMLLSFGYYALENKWMAIMHGKMEMKRNF